MNNLDLFATADDSLPSCILALHLWLMLNQSHTAYHKLLQTFGSPQAVMQATDANWQACGIDAKHVARRGQRVEIEQRIERVLAQAEHNQWHLIVREDDRYPPMLKELADPPPFLWIEGQVEALQQAQIAIVGTRHPTPSGLRHAKQFAQVLSEQGLWVTSGLAQGIDAAAHQGALAAGGGRTLAVLGHGLAHCYPANHRALRAQIVQQGGAVISEFLPDTKPEQYYFPRRNRVVSGLSLGVLVVEAAAKSGSLITAQQALEQNRLVFAIPSHIDNAQAKGCHQLIREGAALVDDPMLIVEELALPYRWQHAQAQTAQPNQITDDVPLREELAVLLRQLDWVGQDVDELIIKTQQDVATLLSQLMELELLGYVLQHGGRYQRCRAVG